jgi:hypothetical protein
MSNFMIFDKETGQKIAEGKGLVLPSDKPGAINSKPWRDANADPIQQMQNALDDFKLREKMTIPELPFPKEAPVLSFKVKISKRRLRKIRQMAIWKKPRLPRKLKKAARHADFDVMDPQFKTDALSDRDAVNFTIEYDMRVRIHPASYPRTKWVQRLTRIVRRMMARQHRRFIQHQLHQQYLDQHPGMLTYNDAPSNPAGHNKDLYAGKELVLDKNQQQRLANILNNKEE